MKTIIALSLVTAMSTPALAQSEGKELAILSFQTTDINDNGFVTRDEMMNQAANIFFSMDADDNNSLVVTEYMGWGFGMRNIAEDKNRIEAYETALKIVFNLWDTDKDTNVTNAEFRTAIAREFSRIDLNHDYKLNESEFIGSFIVNVALRAALTP